MRKIYNLTVIVALSISSNVFAQVGIGNTNPQGALDIISTDNGLIIPRVALTATNVVVPVISATASELVYNTATAGAGATAVTPGFYYLNPAATTWIRIATGPNTDWTTTGNSGTTVGTNYIGTTDDVSLSIKTFDTERMRILNGGHVLVNTTTNNATSGTDNIFEVLATTDGDDAVNGYATGAGIGVFGTTTGTGTGVRGTVNNATAVAVSGSNTDVAGPGIIGSGGGTAGSFYNGSGVSANGTDTGAAGMSTTVATGVGVRGNGNGVTTNTTSGVGAGVSGSGTSIGVFGHASNTSGTKNGGVFTSEHGAGGTGDNPYAYLAGSDGTLTYGGYFDANQDNIAGGGMDYAYTGVVSGGTTYKILGTGTVSTMVKDENNERRILFAPEAPEILFQDYGTGKLQNGIAKINIDPILAKNIFVDEKHPLKVFIQLEGDCNGVYVTNKSKNGFTVAELKDGKSNTEFSWQLVATRADMLDSNGNVHSKHVDVRFPIGPGPIKHREEVKTEVVKIEKTKEIK